VLRTEAVSEQEGVLRRPQCVACAHHAKDPLTHVGVLVGVPGDLGHRSDAAEDERPDEYAAVGSGHAAVDGERSLHAADRADGVDRSDLELVRSVGKVMGLVQRQGHRPVRRQLTATARTRSIDLTDNLAVDRDQHSLDPGVQLPSVATSDAVARIAVLKPTTSSSLSGPSSMIVGVTAPLAIARASSIATSPAFSGRS
jgi:hypothetical protein